MTPPFLTIDLRTSPITLSPFPSPRISPRSDTDDSGPRQSGDDLVSPLTPNDYSRLSGFPQLSSFDFAFDDRSSLNNPPSPSGPRRPSETASVEQLVRPASVAQNSSSAAVAMPTPLPQLSIVVPSNAVAGGVHRPVAATAEDAEAPPPYSRYAGASQLPAVPGPVWGGAAARVAGAQNAPPMVPATIYTCGHQGFASAAGVPVNGDPRRQTGQRGSHALALAGQSQLQQGGKFSRQDSWREKITAGYWETEVEVETGNENKRLTRKGRRSIFAATGLILLVIVIVAIVVGIVTTRKGKDDSDGDDGVSKESTNVEPWFPELREGVHVVKPQNEPKRLSLCVSPSSLWSCSLPGDSLFPRITSQSPPRRAALPEFRFIINIRNGTESGSDPRENTPDATDYDNVAERDNVRTREATKYYISLVTRDSSSTDRGADGTTNNMSEPSSSSPSRTSGRSVTSEPLRKRGLRFKRQDSPVPANMFPETVKDQPLLFFDRGLETEHYGFHMYYTKTIRVTSPTESSEPDPEGGLSLDKGGTVVKWERTRFKVVIWTQKRSDGRVELVDPRGRPTQASVDANDFPYAVSIAQDRYGDKGLIKYGPGSTVREESGEDKRCLCEWKN